MALPTDVTQLVFENLSMDSILTCSRVSRGWRAVIFSNPLLAARIDVDKAIQIFNTNAQLGIDFITRGIGMINDTDHDIARWLECPRLNSQQVGKYLGEKRNKSVLRASLAMKDFKGMHLDESLRKCLATMQPVMTTSGTRRILKAFARRFCECNPTYFCEQVDEAAETAYLLCFAMLMLNTDAHNSMVERKMTRQQFVAYIASSLNLKVKLPYLEGLYDRITRNEIRAEPDAGAMTWVRSMLNWVTGGQ